MRMIFEKGDNVKITYHGNEHYGKVGEVIGHGKYDSFIGEYIFSVCIAGEGIFHINEDQLTLVEP